MTKIHGVSVLGDTLRPTGATAQTEQLERWPVALKDGVTGAFTALKDIYYVIEIGFVTPDADCELWLTLDGREFLRQFTPAGNTIQVPACAIGNMETLHVRRSPATVCITGHLLYHRVLSS